MMVVFNNLLAKNYKLNTFSRAYVSGHQHTIGEIRMDICLKQDEPEPAPQKHGVHTESQSSVYLEMKLGVVCSHLPFGQRTRER